MSSTFSTTMQDILYAGVYEQSEMQLLTSQLEDEDVVVEAGAGIGLVSAFCAKRIGSDRVFAFEANPGMEPHIRETYRLNRVGPSLKIGMLGPSDGQQQFFISEDFWASTSVPGSIASQQSVDVPVYDARKQLDQIGPTFVIMDIEGGEYELLKLLDLTTVRKVLVEIHPDRLGHEQVSEIYSMLSDSGFVVAAEAGVNDISVFFQREPASVADRS